jgi:hypothetical protein
MTVVARPDTTGRLRVLDGEVWVTRKADRMDYRLRPGDSLQIRRGDSVVVEPWSAGAPVCLSWEAQPWRPPGLRALWGAGRTAGWAWLAAVLRRAAAWARARSAASSASRAHGSMSAGDSMASCGALQ